LIFTKSKKHIILIRLSEFGGSNTHLKALIKYFGEDNIILVLETEEERRYLKNITAGEDIKTKIRPRLHKYACLENNFFSNFKELIKIIYSITAIKWLSLRYGGASVNISAIEPEKYLYLLWTPWCRFFYILHTTAGARYSASTTSTCNRMLSKRKMIITVSRANRQFICKNWGLSEKKEGFVKVVYNCLADEPADKVPVNKDYTLKTVVTMGHVIDYKNPSLWLQVAMLVTENHQDARFIWLGNGPLLDEFTLAAKASTQINFPGFTKDTGRYLQMAAIYYQPSLFETQGISVIEAMANHLPCVVSNTGGLPESVKHEYNGLLVTPTDVQQHADAITKLLNDNNLRTQYGSNAYKRYQELFTYNAFRQNMDKIYN
jgi:glycosyltransferase involved in cell wall biosynthesis